MGCHCEYDRYRNLYLGGEITEKILVERGVEIFNEGQCLRDKCATSEEVEMNIGAQKAFAWGGPFCALMFGVGLFIMGFIPPPSPSLSAQEIAAIYQHDFLSIRFGVLLSLIGLSGWGAYVVVISVQLLRIKGIDRLGALTHLATGSTGPLTVMIPLMLIGICSYRPERDPALTYMLNDAVWLCFMLPFPLFLTQFTAFAISVLSDKSATPVFPRWTAYFCLWAGLLFALGVFALFVKSGPFAWSNLFPFWLGGGSFFLWLVCLTPWLLKAIDQEAREQGES